jgi:hypothetical protein
MDSMNSGDMSRIYGIEVLPLSRAIQKSEKENFYLLYQSELPKYSYGILQPICLRERNGYLFVPILKDGKMVF